MRTIPISVKKLASRSHQGHLAASGKMPQEKSLRILWHSDALLKNLTAFVVMLLGQALPWNIALHRIHNKNASQGLTAHHRLEVVFRVRLGKDFAEGKPSDFGSCFCSFLATASSGVSLSGAEDPTGAELGVCPL